MDDHTIMDVNVSKFRESPPPWGDRWREQLRCALRHISCWLAGECPRLRMLSLLSLFQADVVRASSCSFVQVCSMGNDSEHHHNTCDQLTAGGQCIEFKIGKDSRSVGIVGRSYASMIFHVFFIHIYIYSWGMRSFWVAHGNIMGMNMGEKWWCAAVLVVSFRTSENEFRVSRKQDFSKNAHFTSLHKLLPTTATLHFVLLFHAGLLRVAEKFMSEVFGKCVCSVCMICSMHLLLLNGINWPEQLQLSPQGSCKLRERLAVCRRIWLLARALYSHNIS